MRDQPQSSNPTARTAGPPSECPDRRPSGWRRALPLAALFALALGVRLAYLLQVRDAPIFSVLVVDARSYDRWAQEIAAGNWLGDRVFYQAPLYPYFLGSIYAVFGHSLWAVRLVQAAIGAGSCVLLAAAGRRFFRPREAMLAGVLLALYPPAIFFDGLVQKAVLGLFCTVLLLYVLGRSATAGSSWKWLAAAGAVLGLFSLTRENALVLLAVVGAWLLLPVARTPWSRRLAHAAVFAAAAAAVLLPVALRNMAVGGEFFLTTSQMGPNFYIGNHAHATGLYVPLRPGRGSPEFERQDATELAEAAAGRKLSPREVSRYWLRQALRDIRAGPGRWLRLMLRKALLTWNAAEIVDAEDIEVYREGSWLLRGLSLCLHFGVICPLGVLGLCLSWGDRRRLWLLYAMLLGFAGSVTAFYVFARYRFPMVPFLLLFAGAGLLRGIALLRRAEWRRLCLCGCAAVAAAVAANWRLVPTERLPAATHINLGNVLLEQGRAAEAAAQYSRALALLPGSADVHNNLGVALTQLDRAAEAAAHYSMALRVDPQYPNAARGLATALEKQGTAWQRQGRRAEALACYDAAVRAWPEAADARNAAGIMLVELGRFDEAAAHFSALLRLRPDQPTSHNNLGALLTKQGRVTEAIAHFSEAVRIRPDYADAHNNLGGSFARLGRMDQAVHHFSECLRTASDPSAAHRNLARILLDRAVLRRQEGRLPESRADAQQALAHAQAVGHAELTAQAQALLQSTTTSPEGS